MPFFSEQEFLVELDRLNPEQRLVVDTIDGPLMVIAGPGSGKTQILTLRVANILRLTDINPHNILCLTFTDAASKNMQERLSRFLGVDAYKVHIHTFHSFCSSVINQYSDRFVERFGLGARAIEDFTRLELFKKILQVEPPTNPLAGFSSEHGFYHLNKINSAISKLKKAGINQHDFNTILSHLECEIELLREFTKDICAICEPSLTKTENKQKVLELINAFKQKLTECHTEKFAAVETISFIKHLLEVLECKMNLLEKGEITLSKARECIKNLICKDKNNEDVLELEAKLNTYRGLSKIYSCYYEEMYKNSFYDFDDMIMEVNTVLSGDDDIKFNLIEKYQYILVDEFQDTNGSQFDLVFNLIDNEFNEGRPNIMVVGDDDQSIYKFQGATTTNILNFNNEYSPEIVSLQKNYRSSHKIVESSRTLAELLDDKITDTLTDFTKHIVAHNDYNESEIHKLKFDSDLEENYQITIQIKELIESGVSPDTIAILSRSHKKLESICEFMILFGLPVNYEKGNNVLHNSKINQLVTMMEFVNTLNQKNSYEKDSLLVQIFNFDCFGFEPGEIRNLALQIEKYNQNIRNENKELAFENRKKSLSWIDFILDLDMIKTTSAFPNSEQEINPEFQRLTQFFFDLSKKAQQEPVEKIIDYLVGVEKILEDNEGHGEYDEDIKQTELEEKIKFLSPYKSHYFDKIIKYDEEHNLQFLSNLSFLINKIRSLEDGSFLKLSRVVEILDSYKNSSSLLMIDKSSFISSQNSVNLMTAHKSKGLEFEYVFVIGCNQSSWKPSNKNDGVLPGFLHLDPLAEDINDYLRLFYVAITRAKKHLFLSYSDTSEDGGKSNELSFLSALPEEHLNCKVFSDAELKLKAINFLVKPQDNSLLLVNSEKQNLYSLLDNYSLSVTHLNNFLDMENGGPKKFLEMNLLRFPQSKDKSSGYGTAVHNSLCEAYKIFKKDKVKIPIEDLLFKFEISLRNQKLLSLDFDNMLARGKLNLPHFWSMRNMESKFEVEREFKNIQIGNARLGGNIDKMIFEDSQIVVVDYKTGKPLTEWDRYKTGSKDGRFESGDFKDYKFQKHQNQLLFYKLLVEHSGFYSGQKVNLGRLEFPNCNEGFKYNFIPTLDLELNPIELQKLEKLTQAVWKRIMNLDFSLPRVYESSYAGTLDWIKDLLEG
jgi:DNA helicase II / ATP-dependent DNA helicase PcrA